MERNARIVLVISFFVILTVAMLLFYRWIQPADPGARATSQAVLFGGSVSGLSIGSDVRYLGVPVGRVSSIALSKDFAGHVDVTFTTDEALPPADSLLAMLQPQGITGLSVVELRNRTQEIPGFATPPGTIPGYPSVFARLTDSAGQVASSLQDTLQRIDNQLRDEVFADLTATLHQSRVLMENLARASGSVDELVASAARASGELEQTLPSIRRVALRLENDVLPKVAGAGTSLQQAAAGVDATVTANSENIERLLSRDLPSLAGTTDELAIALQRLSLLLASLHDEPGVLLYGKQMREVEIPRD